MLGLAGYLLLCRLLRYRALRQIQDRFPTDTRDDLKQMTTKDAWEIQRWLFATEFPFTSEKALSFALFRTYAIPTISKLLMKTKQFTDPKNAGKRYSDTQVLISEFIGMEPSSERANAATARLNYIHGVYQQQGLISNDDMLYTLSLFALEPVRWINRYEWRKLTDLEVCAMGTFWKSQGDAMNISFQDLPGYGTWASGLEWWESVKIWSESYEKQHMVPDPNNHQTADETTKLLLYDVPKAAYPLGKHAVSALLDERLRTAIWYANPPAFLQDAVQTALAIRKYLLRYAFLPRPWAFRVRYILDEPDAQGRLYLVNYAAEPWYVENSFWNKWGPYALFKMLVGSPVPSAKFSPGGYTISDVGPNWMKGKGDKEYQETLEHLMGQNRGRCPFGFTES